MLTGSIAIATYFGFSHGHLALLQILVLDACQTKIRTERAIAVLQETFALSNSNHNFIADFSPELELGTRPALPHGQKRRKPKLSVFKICKPLRL
jgi:hypothetical protein